MMEFSIKEAEMLCFKAARGAGYSWGLAEEAGFAASWLAKQGLSDLANIVRLLESKRERPFGELDLDQFGSGWAPADGSVLCPISIGAFLSDHSHCVPVWNSIAIVTTQLPQPDAFIDGPSDGSEVEDELIRRGFQGFQDVPTLFS
nr:DUF3726 domain-containing protein [Rhizobiaceae bacterium]